MVLNRLSEVCSGLGARKLNGRTGQFDMEGLQVGECFVIGGAKPELTEV